MTALLEQNIAACLQQSCLLMPTLALALNPFLCPLSSCANTNDPLREAHTLSLLHTHAFYSLV